MIFGMPGRDNEESGNPFMKSKMIAGNPENTFRKIKNYIDVFKNDFRISKIYFSFRKINWLEIICRDET